MKWMRRLKLYCATGTILASIIAATWWLWEYYMAWIAWILVAIVVAGVASYFIGPFIGKHSEAFVNHTEHTDQEPEAPPNN